MNPTVDKLNNFIKEMSHFDPDNMEMGAKAVCELVLSGQLKLQENKQTADKIRDAFIKQMESENYNVHAHAIRCIADMVPKLPSDQIQHVFSKIIKSIADKDLDEKKREIYGICAGTVIHQAAQEYGDRLSELFVESVKQLMTSKDQKNEIEVILINVISEFIRKWPLVSNNCRYKFDCNELVIYLLRNVQTKSKLQIVKKSQTGLGKVALILPKSNLETLFQHKDYGILLFLNQNQGKLDLERMKKMRNGLFCLANVLKAHNGQVKYWARNIAYLLIRTIFDYKNNDNIDQIDLTCDILDCSIICMSYLLKSYSRELQQFLNDPSFPLTNFVEELIDFNIEGQMSYVSLQDQAMRNDYGDGDGQDDYGYYDAEGDIDEKGWKVRRATMHYVIVLLKKDKNFRNMVSQSSHFIQLLSAKLIQTNSMVSEMAFQTFHSLIESISQQTTASHQGDLELSTVGRLKSFQKQIAKIIIDEIISRIQIILQSSRFSDHLKIEGNRIIHRLVQIFHQNFQLNPQLVDFLLKILSKQLSKTQIIQNRNYCLLSIKQLIVHSQPFFKYDEVLKQTMRILKSSSNSLKVMASCYKCIRTFINMFPTQFILSNHFLQLLTVLKTKLKEHDADRIIKHSVIKCLGAILQNYMNILKPEDQKDIISALNTKLHIEVEKNYILEEINKIPNDYKVKSQNIKLYRDILEVVSANLGSSNAELNFQVMEATGKLMKILAQNLDKNIVEHILSKTKPIFSEYKVPQFLETLIISYPAYVKPYAESIIRSTESKYIELLIGNKIVNQSDCIKILKQIDRQDSAKNISLILAKIGVSQNQLKSQIAESKWGLVCLGALGYIGGLQSAKYLTDIMLNHKNQEFKLEAASALGKITSRFQTSLLSEITVMAQKSGDFYMFIYSLKEFLNFKLQNQLTSTSIDFELIEWLFKKSQRVFEGESIYHLIAECVGKIIALTSKQVSLIEKFACSSIESHRFIVANSLKFYFEKQSDQTDNQTIEKYIKAIILLISDKSVNVRCAATKSLNSRTSEHMDSIKILINKDFWKAFKQNLSFDESLIIEVDYGISKQKKDLGRPLRIESFNFLGFLLKSCPIDSQLVDELMTITLYNINKQSNADLVIKRLVSLRKLCDLDFTQFISHIGVFIQKISMEDGVLKGYQNKSVVQDQMSDVYLKSILKEIVLINKQAQKQNIDQIRGYLCTLKNVKRFAQILDSKNLITTGEE